MAVMVRRVARGKDGIPTRHCDLAGCYNHTHGRKPYCTKHVFSMPYVQKLNQEIVDQEAEWDRARHRAYPVLDVGGVTAQEILMHVKLYGPRSVLRLCKDLNLERAVVEPYIKALQRKGHVRVSLNKRYVPIVHLVVHRQTRRGA